MMRYKTKFNLLRDEVVKANNELVDNEIFETYMDEEQDAIMVTNTIVRALVKTIKVLSKKAHKLDRLEPAYKDACKTLVAFDERLNEQDNEISELKDKIMYYETMELEYQDQKEDYVSEYEESQELLTQRDKEINALKHMLDRKDDENEICDY